ncbi:hypothetical protein CGL27_16240 [Streptomyces sp. 11-1-2]|nr:hypothetical protein CGL27_16240 [Streptomyces sp. 11-1-2]
MRPVPYQPFTRRSFWVSIMSRTCSASSAEARCGRQGDGEVGQATVTDRRAISAHGQDGFRDGCRVPLPWTVSGPSYGFGSGGAWLPQPADWGRLSVEAQSGKPDSTLEVYRMALAVRRQHPALGAGTSVVWLDAPAGVLAFRRTAEDGRRFVCTSNTTQEPVRISVYGQLLLASATAGIQVTESHVVLPGDSTVWWTD